MDLAGLKAEVDRRFDDVDRRFVDVDRRFEKIDLRFDEVDRRFERVDQAFVSVRQEIAELRDFIGAEGERTRRHFDIVAEQMKSERNLVLDQALGTGQQLLRLTASNAADHVGIERRLDDHERRLSNLENE